MRILFVLLFFATSALAQVKDGILTYQGQIYTLDPVYSQRDFTGLDLSDAKIIAGDAIYASTFSHETPDTHVFPETMQGITFIDCNLDNVFIPAGNRVIAGSQRRFKAQADGQDWIVDAQSQPLEPVNKDLDIAQNVNIDPKNLVVSK